MRALLEEYLRSKLPRKKDLSITEFRPIKQGNSNEMATITLCWREDSSIYTRKYILRMPPQKSIMYPYDPSREYQLLVALKSTSVPVPGVLLLEEDKAILGKPFLIMEKVEGETFSFAYHALTPEKKKRLSFQYAKTLANIHSIDWKGQGLLTQEAPRDAAQFAALEVKKCRESLQGIRGIPRQMLEDALGRIGENLPQDGDLALIHGDYNIGNVLFSNDKIIAILDWETACIGDPTLDLGWLYPGNALTLGLPMKINDFVALYHRGGGRKTINLQFYQQLAMVKLIIACTQACLLLGQEKRNEANLHQMVFTIPYLLNSLCYLVSICPKAFKIGKWCLRKKQYQKVFELSQ